MNTRPPAGPVDWRRAFLDLWSTLVQHHDTSWATDPPAPCDERPPMPWEYLTDQEDMIRAALADDFALAARTRAAIRETDR